MTQADVQVEQVDREAAADLIESYYGAGHWSEEHEAMKKLAASLRAGHGGLWPAAFARHRQQSILAYEAERAALVEAAAQVAEQYYAGHGQAMQTTRAYNYEHAGKSIAAAIRAALQGAKP